MDLRSELRLAKRVFRDSRAVQSPLLRTLLRFAFHRLRGRRLALSSGAAVYGATNISGPGLLTVGLEPVGFMDRHDRTMLRASGKVRVNGDFAIAKGCRVLVGPEATVDLGFGYMNPNTLAVIMRGLKLGDGCAISWGCQFLDSDFHQLERPGSKSERSAPIMLGDRVWVASNVTILKGTTIASGCVVATGSVVKGVFGEENCLIAGNPAKVVKTNIMWK
jgi:acetyltransferase-like isoleucine patch superfamily enzyme